MSRFIDETGNRFGKLVVIERVSPSLMKKKGSFWLCQCDCGKRSIVGAYKLRSGHTTSCGCLRTVDETGNRFGKLTVIKKYTGERKARNNATMWLCQCDCGKETVVVANNLRNRNGKGTQSCGCLVGKSNLRDITNKTFGKLTALYIDTSNKKRYIKWICRCECGNIVSVISSELFKGRKKDCGCTRYIDPNEIAFNRYLISLKGGAKHRGLSFTLSKDDIKSINNQNCHYCGSSPKNVSISKSGSKPSGGIYTYNGIDRVDSSMGYEINNVVPCCWRCNTMKMDMKLDDFLDHVSKIYKNTIEKENRNHL